MEKQCRSVREIKQEYMCRNKTIKYAQIDPAHAARKKNRRVGDGKWNEWADRASVSIARIIGIDSGVRKPDRMR
jgi:hypothetical protein